VVVGVGDQGPPDFEKAWPVFIDALHGISPDEAIYHWHSQQFRRLNELADMVNVNLRFGMIRHQWIGIITQSANRYARRTHGIPHALYVVFAEIDYVDVRHAGITPFGLARGPAHHFKGCIAALL